MECYSCYAISELHLAISGRIDDPANKCINMCCRKGDIPAVPLTSDPEKNLEHFLGMRHLEIIRGLSDNAKDHNPLCEKCDAYIKSDWSFSTHIVDVNLSMYPSPCQCHCLYCKRQGQHYNTQEYIKNNAATVSEAYEHAFETLKLAKKIGLIVHPETRWQVSCGEITIHPYRKEILDLTRGEKVCFYTNAFIFDKDIARELHDNPAATINLSIDSGTAETWRKVKGVDNFNHVLENLIAYRKASSRAGQITLKYIVMPGINDSEEDFRNFVDIVKALNARFYFSRDITKIGMTFSKNAFYPEVVESAARLLAISTFNGLIAEMLHGYTACEQQQIKLLAQKILEYMQ